eukprot:CAMPEP_0113937096 /NCGR_PEP_ID=MMETSP1339-20121228/3797_1 /TAXON_ID=94617 /ORGANISM="Fibrocapsa japonica" /LENGTH=237 /DNA_ID=CAMNT_0000939743 /DNA_START=294 /DNA_END=1007 /DNA_ORIENTATION=+ /assembly_acc=CAM_ASM_000762
MSLSLSGECLLPKLPPLRNKYYAFRHGQSTANVRGIISSSPAKGTTSHGLTETGKRQAREAAPAIVDMIGGSESLNDLIVYSSDFTRARETALEAVDEMWRMTDVSSPKPVVNIEKGLRERFFGELDGKDLITYNDVWPLDLEDAHHNTFGVESVNTVVFRVRETIMELEERHENKSIILTSHADTLQILQLYVANADVRSFSSYRFKNGEVRALIQKPSSLPTPVPLERMAGKRNP